MNVEELRPLTAGRLLAIRREAQAEGVEDWALGTVCNARVLAECCYTGGARVFPNGEAVLDTLTVREMERLLGVLTEDGLPAADGNPNFDPKRFRELKEG